MLLFVKKLGIINFFSTFFGVKIQRNTNKHRPKNERFLKSFLQMLCVSLHEPEILAKISVGRTLNCVLSTLFAHLHISITSHIFAHE